MSALGIFESSSDSIVTMMNDLVLTKIDAAKLSRKSSTSLFGAHTIFYAAGINHGRIRNFYSFRTIFL